ncbi:GAG-pre-integrase domain [Popillia japonica]|uniref:GAG-pre-integrase domain n=1 Tax=Popillia japonica TaxID=7064 RepID=A0AAW1LSZ5_POPJA
MKNTNWQAKRNTEKYDRNKYARAEASSKVIFCFSCGGKGHIAKFCRKANKKDENNEASGSVAAVSREYRALCMNKKEQVYNINEWTLDSGATDHMTPFKEFLSDFIEVNLGTVIAADGNRLKIKGKGKALLDIEDEYGGWKIELGNVLYVPQLEDNLVSLSKIEENGSKIIIDEGTAKIVNKNEIVIVAKKRNLLYKFETKEIMRKAAKVTSIDTWHRRFGHVHTEAIKKIPELEIKGNDEQKDCITCIQGKMRRRKFPIGEAVRTKEALEVVYHMYTRKNETKKVSNW